jgi:DeoR/GlpR family transcriptional regulator of sugar metabolism
MDIKPGKRFYTVEELAEEFIVSRETIRRLIRTGQHESRPMDRYHSIPVASVVAFVESAYRQAQNGTSEATPQGERIAL